MSADQAGADLLLDVDRGELKRRSVHGAAATVASHGIRFVLQFGSQLLLARLLTPSQFGLVAMVAPIVGLGQMFGEMGLVQATVQKPTISQQELSCLFWINQAVTTGLALALIACSPLVAWFYGEPRVADINALLCSLLIIFGLAGQPIAILNRTMRFMALAAIDIGTALAAAAVGIVAALAGMGYWSLVMMQVANALVIIALAWPLAGWRPSRPQWVPGAGRLLRFGAHIMAFDVVNYLSYSIDNVLIGAVWGEFILGLYDRGARLMLLPVMQIINPFTRVAVPLLSRLQDSPEKYREAYTKMLRALLLTTTPGIVFAVVMADPLVVLLLGQRWAAVGPILAWLGVASLATPLNLSTTWLFVSQNRADQQLKWFSIGTAITVLGIAAGLPWGGAGVAASRAGVVWLATAPLLWWAVTREGPVRLGDILQSFYPSLIAGLGTFAILSVVRPELLRLGNPGLPVALAAAYLLHAAILACLPEGNRSLREFWSLRTMFSRA